MSKNNAATSEFVERPVMDTAEIEAATEMLDNSSSEEILRWAVRRFYPKLLMATAFGAEGCVIMHWLAQIEPRVKIINLDTGYQFPETLQLRERFQEKYGIEIELIQPELPVREYEAEHGGPLYELRSDQCCHDRKVLPLRAAMARLQPLAWISSIRKDQTSHRAAAQVVQWDAKFSVVKVNPLLHWTKNDLWKYILEQEIPYNPLHDQGYPSIGCWPCTRAVLPGEDERAGRWAGQVKKECGLHVVEENHGSGI